MSIVEPGAIATPIWDRGSATADALFAAMPPEAHERYGELVATMRAEAAQAARRGLPPEVVANVIAKALTAKRPRSRYLIGRDAKVSARLARVLPGRAMDAVLAAAIRSRR